MPRPKKPRYRLGHKEQRIVRQMATAIRTFRLWTAEADHRETRLNKKLSRHLRRHLPSLDLRNADIAVPDFVGETYRPEFFVPGEGDYPLCCFECKKLPRTQAKKNFMTAVSQALLYSAPCA